MTYSAGSPFPDHRLTTNKYCAVCFQFVRNLLGPSLCLSATIRSHAKYSLHVMEDTNLKNVSTVFHFVSFPAIKKKNQGPSAFPSSRELSLFFV